MNTQGDRYIGGGQGFGIRRARVILYGDVHPQVSVYLQTDFASVISDAYHVPSVRDWYADLYLTKNKDLRVRVGQSKVPYGFENLQSSQNRLPLDRADATNSGVKDERDLGAFAYWAPESARTRFKSLVDDNLKGSGDYGVLALGIYNGQTANKADTNGNLHVVARATYPIALGSQILEVGASGYVGKYRVSTEELDDGRSFEIPDAEGDVLDRRVAAHLVLYPQPVGFAAEYTLGEGPAQVDGDALRIDAEALSGGYVQAMVKVEGPLHTVSLTPFVRAQMYDGGRKFEKNAPTYHIREIEGGAEWQIVKATELTLTYAYAERNAPTYPYDLEVGQLFRAQVQFNY